MKARRPLTLDFTILALFVVLSLVTATLFGTADIAWDAFLHSGTIEYHIFWNLRVPRTLVAFLAGSGLALCGMVFQALFLNTLATPFTLGVAGGASFGAAVVIYLSGLHNLFVGPSVTAGAMLGAGLAMALVLGFSHTRMGSQRHVMLLAGVAVSLFFSSMLLLIQSLSSFYQSFQIIRWLMGGIAVAGYREVLILVPILIPGFIIVLFYTPRLNLLMLGDDMAHARGLAVARTKRWLFIVVSLMVATIVSVTGPIGFVGLVIPHVCRLIWGGNHRVLAPASLCLGGAVLVLCDLLSRLLLAPSEIPVGVITSMLGAPFFFLLLMRRAYRF